MGEYVTKGMSYKRVDCLKCKASIQRDDSPKKKTKELKKEIRLRYGIISYGDKLKAFLKNEYKGSTGH
jgi:hypothetical protein